MYLYVLMAHTSFSVRLSVNLSDGFKDNPDGVIAIKKFLVHQGRKGKSTRNTNVRELWRTVRREDYRKQEKAIWVGL